MNISYLSVLEYVGLTIWLVLTAQWFDHIVSGSILPILAKVTDCLR